MKIDILTLFPEMFKGPFAQSIVKRAQDKKLVQINIHNLRRWTNDKRQTVDDRPFGGGAGMILMVKPVFKALEELKTAESKTILLTPQGKIYNQNLAFSLSHQSHLLLICGHYEGVDQRILDSYPFEEWSCGDYVLSGGELPFALMVDAVVRLIPGVLSNADSPQNETFSNGSFDFPQYTRPRVFRGREVPPVLLSGNHEAIKSFREALARKKQQEVRPDLGEAKSGISV